MQRALETDSLLPKEDAALPHEVVLYIYSGYYPGDTFESFWLRLFQPRRKELDHVNN